METIPPWTSIVPVGCTLRHRPESRLGLEFSLGGPRPFGSCLVTWPCPRQITLLSGAHPVCLSFPQHTRPCLSFPAAVFFNSLSFAVLCDFFLFYLTTFRFLIDSTFPSPVYIPSCWVRSRIGPVLPFIVPPATHHHHHHHHHLPTYYY